ncbi:transketolase [Micromonospora radicis]|uniref:Transketolase n=1 Tax=Micromonospora radicis TaxID=1894971 RepID=A0A418MPY8_9ACTN|nr:transketolase [Micromonospora radicis]RIV34574.1 transketolase [Micromonospora radicis]
MPDERGLDASGLRVEAAHARLLVLRMLRAGGSGHLGGVLSCIDIVTALYFRALRVDPTHPEAPTRDRFLLSAGHKAMAQYAVLARRGFFPESWLDSYGGLGSRLAGHPDMHKLPGVEANTGALGHGLSIAAGMALGARLATTGARVFTILGDGELPEGANWEGASIAAHHRLGNLVAFVDVNDLQISGPTREVMGMEPIDDKFRSFGWNVTTIDGNDMAQILDVFDGLNPAATVPTAVVARTVKAKGISTLENTVASHYWKPSEAELDAAEEELRATLDAARRESLAVVR